MLGSLKLSSRARLHLSTGETIDGVVSRDRGRWLVIQDARIVRESASTTLSGEVWVLRDHVRFAQRGVLAE